MLSNLKPCDVRAREAWVSLRFDELFGPEFRHTKNGAACLKHFRKWLMQGRCVMASTLVNRRGIIALKVSLREAVNVEPS